MTDAARWRRERKAMRKIIKKQAGTIGQQLRTIHLYIPIVKAAMAWRRAGANPCGEPGCACTECRLWEATS